MTDYTLINSPRPRIKKSAVQAVVKHKPIVLMIVLLKYIRYTLKIESYVLIMKIKETYTRPGKTTVYCV